jgi:hypothetical protein
MAFWVQYNANQNIYKENKKQQNERQFYEMLKIHRDNVDKVEFIYLGCKETTWTQPQVFSNTNKHAEMKYTWMHLKGQPAISSYLCELKVIYRFLEGDATNRFQKAYDIFFNGLYNSSSCSQEEKETLRKKGDDVFNKGLYENDVQILPQCTIMKGYKPILNPYYRHLYLTVKSIVDSNFDEDEKKMFLKTLRASLTAEEQALLLFNWYYGKLNGDGYGIKWEYEGEINHKYCNQKYFTEWKMIHNLVGKDFQFVSEMDSFKKLAVLLNSNFNADDYNNLRELFEEA